MAWLKYTVLGGQLQGAAASPNEGNFKVFDALEDFEQLIEEAEGDDYWNTDLGDAPMMITLEFKYNDGTTRTGAKILGYFIDDEQKIIDTSLIYGWAINP